MSDFPQYGSCECQSIRYEIIAEPLFIHVCHCTRCQKRTGSAFNITVLVFVNDFALIEGKPDHFLTTTDSGAELSTYTCSSCRDNLYHTHPGYTGIVMPTGGTLDDRSWVQPKAHIYTESKQPWVQLPDGIPTFSEMYKLEDVWPKESIAKLSDTSV